MLVHLGWLVVSLLPFGMLVLVCLLCKRLFSEGNAWSLPCYKCWGRFKALFPIWGWVNIFPVGGELRACLGLPDWSGSWPDSLPGLSAILHEDTGALLRLEWQQTPALATSPLIAGGETEARSSEVASCKPLLSGFFPRGVELPCLPAELSFVQTTHLPLPAFSSLVVPGPLC